MKFWGVIGIFFCYKYLLLDQFLYKTSHALMAPIKRHHKAIEKAIENTPLEFLPRGHWIALALLLVCLVAALASPNNSAELSSNSDSAAYDMIPLPHLDAALKAADIIPLAQAQNDAVIPPLSLPTAAPIAPQPKEFTVQSGDSLSLIFRRAGLNDRDIYELFSDSQAAKALRKIKPGQQLSFLVNNSQLQTLTYQIDILESLTFTRAEKGFDTINTSLTPEIKHAFSQGVIDSSLYMAGKRAGLSTSLTMELANIFGWDIDFALDIQKGDSFKVMYEEQLLDGKRIGNGKILAAEFTNDGKTFKAVRYTDKDGVSRYYTPDGRGMQKAFLRSPIEFARISSHFSLSRKHPVLHIIRAHKGTDYAAARGTPIRAAGDGKISLAGRKGGYGNCIVINHSSGYQTLYGHMHNFAKGMRAGVRVNQGDIIGYVGSTGLASGPHLHYEFHVNGQVRNPVTVTLPKATGIDKTQLAHFNEATLPLIAQLDQFSEATQVALAKTPSTTN
jgi:murein DD-endopeptidase MepM/ murein hydrolase activator NlpD